MPSIFRPKRGKKATAENQNIVLKKGEVFFEVPDSGIGTGIGKIKMGDGVTTYSNLPYFMECGNNNKSVTVPILPNNYVTSSAGITYSISNKICTIEFSLNVVNACSGQFCIANNLPIPNYTQSLNFTLLGNDNKICVCGLLSGSLFIMYYGSVGSIISGSYAYTIR